MMPANGKVNAAYVPVTWQAVPIRRSPRNC